MRIIKSLDDLLARAETVLLITLLACLILLSTGQVVLRNLFNEGLLWADILSRQLVLWVGFLGASLAVRENRHLSIDFIPHIVPERFKRWLSVVSRLAAAVISLFLVKASWSFLMFEREGEATLFSNIPVWWFQTILPYSLAVIAIRFFVATLDSAFNKETPK